MGGGHVFVLDTSPRMAERIHGSLRRMDAAKAFVEAFVRNRERDPSHRSDTYALVTLSGDGGGLSVVDREWPFDTFLDAVRAASPTHLPTLPGALALALAAARAHRLATLGDNPSANDTATPVPGCDVPGVSEDADVVVVLGTDHWCEAPGEPLRTDPLNCSTSPTLRNAMKQHAAYAPGPRASDVRVHCAVMRMHTDVARGHHHHHQHLQTTTTTTTKPAAASSNASWCVMAQVCEDTAGVCVGASSLRGAALAAERVANTAARASILATINLASHGGRSGDDADATTPARALVLPRPLHFDRAAVAEPPPFDATTGRRETYESLGRPLPPAPPSHSPSHWPLPLGERPALQAQRAAANALGLHAAAAAAPEVVPRPQFFVDTNASASATESGAPPLAGYPIDTYELDLRMPSIADVESAATDASSAWQLRSALSAAARRSPVCWPVYAIGSAAAMHSLGPEKWSTSAADTYRAIGRLRCDRAGAPVTLEVCGHGFATLWPLLRELRAKSAEWERAGDERRLAAWLQRLENWARRLAPPHLDATRRALQRCGVGPRLVSALPTAASAGGLNVEAEAARWRKAREAACAELDMRMRVGAAAAAAEARCAEALRRRAPNAICEASALGSETLQRELIRLAARPDGSAWVSRHAVSLAALPAFANPFDAGPDDAAFRAEASLLPLVLQAGAETMGGTRAGGDAAMRVRRFEAVSVFERSHRVPAAAMGEYRWHMMRRAAPLRDPIALEQQHVAAEDEAARLQLAASGGAPAHVRYLRASVPAGGVEADTKWPSPLAWPRRTRGGRGGAPSDAVAAPAMRPLGIVADEADVPEVPSTPDRDTLSRKRKLEEGGQGVDDGRFHAGALSKMGAFALAEAYTLARSGAPRSDVRSAVLRAGLSHPDQRVSTVLARCGAAST